MSESELASCPFCGADAHIIYDGPTPKQIANAKGWGHDIDGGYRAQCKACGTSVGEFHTRSECAPAWNRRSPDRDAAAGKMMAALEEADAAMEMQERRQAEEFHVTGRTAWEIWSKARSEIAAALALAKASGIKPGE